MAPEARWLNWLCRASTMSFAGGNGKISMCRYTLLIFVSKGVVTHTGNFNPRTHTGHVTVLSVVK
jgi:hypothetical protein